MRILNGSKSRCAIGDQGGRRCPGRDLDFENFASVTRLACPAKQEAPFHRTVIATIVRRE